MMTVHDSWVCGPYSHVPIYGKDPYVEPCSVLAVCLQSLVL